MFWNTEKIKEKCASSAIILPYNESRVKHCAYELAVGSAYYTTDLVGKNRIYNHQQFEILPGQFALLETKENVSIPNSAIGLISIKAGVKFRGLLNVSGFHVDPGFNGKLVFSVYNAGSQTITLEEGKEIFLLWFADLSGATLDVYNGNSNNGITVEMIDKIKGTVASPSELNIRVNALERNFKIAISLATVLATTIVALISSMISGIFHQIVSGIIK